MGETPGECDHIQGYVYGGRFAGIRVTEADLRDTSLVDVPADKHCLAFRVTSTIDGIRGRDGLFDLGDTQHFRWPVDMSEHTLIGLAILTVNWDRGHDVLDSFVPLVASHLERDAEKPVSALELQQNLIEDTGIKIPLGALHSILKRCAERGITQAQRWRFYYPDSRGCSRWNSIRCGRVLFASTNACLKSCGMFAKEQANSTA